MLPLSPLYILRSRNLELPFSSRTMTTISQILASHLQTLSFESLPSEVVEKTRMAVLDLLGAALDGSQSEESSYLNNALARLDQGQGGTIWGRGTEASYPMAALANGTAAHARELDDWGGGLHPGAVCIPTAIAAAECLGANGREIILAIVAGYEVMMRVAEAAGGDAQYDSGWHPTGTCGSLGAAAAASKILHLDEQQTVWALGLAGSFTGGTLAFLKDGAMSKRFHPGKAAETGLVAAFMAQQGFTGPAYIFEAEKGGFLTTYGAGTKDTTALSETLYDEFRIMRSGLKPYASCRDVHAAVDAVLALKARTGLKAAQISHILVETTHEAKLLCAKKECSTILDAQMSIPYGVAIALAGAKGDLRRYTQSQLANESIARLADKVDVVASPKFETQDHCAELTVELVDGQTVVERVDIASGDPLNPMAEHEVVGKFCELAATRLQTKQVEQVVDIVSHLEELEAVTELTRVLSATRTA